MPNALSFQPVTRLVNLDLDKIALCNQGANSRANILLTKRKETTQMATFNEIAAELKPDALAVLNKHISDTALSAVAKAVEPLTAELDLLRKASADEKLKAEAAAKLKAEADAKAGEPDVMKGVSKETKEYVENLQKSILKLQEDADNDRVEKNFAMLKSIPAEEAILKGILKTASPDLLAVLAKTAAAIDATVLNKATGSTGEQTTPLTSDEAIDAIEKIATEIVTKSGKTHAQAFTDACTQHPDLYTLYANGGKN